MIQVEHASFIERSQFQVHNSAQPIVILQKIRTSLDVQLQLFQASKLVNHLTKVEIPLIP
jgi:hypothetical protein